MISKIQFSDNPDYTVRGSNLSKFVSEVVFTPIQRSPSSSDSVIVTIDDKIYEKISQGFIINDYECEILWSNTNMKIQ